MSVITVATLKQKTQAMLDPDAALWDDVEPVRLALSPTPRQHIPSAYVQAAWRERSYGIVRELDLRAAMNDATLALRLEWPVLTPRRVINDIDAFPDACAVLFLENGASEELSTMGSPSHPVHGWHWRAGTDDPYFIRAEGLGTVERIKPHALSAAASWSEGRWHVVMEHALDSPPLLIERGDTLPVGIAVWAGSASERAGVKSHTAEAHELVIS